MNNFQSAILDENGQVDIGYMALAWGLVVWSASVLSILLAGIATALMSKDSAGAAAIFTSTGVAIAAVSGGFATMLGAVGLFRYGDRPRPNWHQPDTVTKTESKTETVTQTAVVVPPAPSDKPKD